jgi:(2Fe-2S) ferredoxin
LDKPFLYHVLPCGGPKCGAEQAETCKNQMKDLLPNRKALSVRISTTSCQGMCELGPNLTIYPEGIVYHGLDSAQIDRVALEHLAERRPLPFRRGSDDPDRD